MKTNIIKIFWGVVLIGLGMLFLADTLGYVDMEIITRQGWFVVFAITSAAFFLCYFLAGVHKWGWLFPALLSAALALILGLLPDNHGSALVAIPILLSIGIPFYVGYLTDRKAWGLLIPAWIMTVTSIIVVLSEGDDSDLIGASVLFSIASPFLIVYLINHKHKWALITGLALAFIGLFPLVETIVPGDFKGPVVMFLFTVFFCIIYFISKQSWWALIPSGIFASIGVVVLLDSVLPNNDYFMIGGLIFGGYTGALFLGFAVTFGILWLLRDTRPTAWAIYPAVGSLIVSILAFLMWQTASNLVVGVALLVIGVAMILGSIVKGRASNQLTSDRT